VSSSCSALTITGLPSTANVSETSQFMGWYDMLDFAAEFSNPPPTGDATEWVQKSVNLAVQSGLPLYFPPRPYVISRSIMITGSCALLGIDSSVDTFGQAGTTHHPLTGAASATLVALTGGMEMLCVTGDDVVIQNINFVATENDVDGGMAVHLSGNSNVTISDVAIFGTRNGILIDSASNVRIEDVLIVPNPVSLRPRYGIKADGLANLQAFGPTGAAGGAVLSNCVVDQTVYPYVEPPGDPNPQEADAFIIDNGYQGMTLNGCEARGAHYGFVSQNTSGGASGRPGNFFVNFCRAYNCTVGLNLIDGQLSMMADSLIVLDSGSSAPSGSPNYGIQIANTYGGGPITFSNNVVFGNSSNLVGIGLSGASAVTINGGMVGNCGLPDPPAGHRGTGIAIDAPASGSYLVQGVVVTNCSVAAVEVEATHAGNASLVGLNIAKNTSAGATPAYGLLIDTPTASGTILVNACVFNQNDEDVLNNAANLSAALKALHKVTNNVGVTPSALLPPVSLVPEIFNNSGNDVFVYVASPTGADGTITVNGQSVSGIGTVPGVFFVPDSGAIAVTGASWTWLPS
jgi:hypothetical protein